MGPGAVLRAATLAAAAVVIALPSSASGATGQHGQVAAIAFTVGSTPVTVTTHGVVPARADVQAFVLFNGHDPQAFWLDSPLEIEYGWHGVVVTITGQHRRAPATVRAASTRRGVVRVYVRLVWP